MTWSCASCGWEAKNNRQRCPRCGSRLWKLVLKKDMMELSGPLKRIAPKGLLLARPGKQTPIQDSGSIECGKCHGVIYKADKGFDAKAFQAAKKRHYLISPECEEQK